MSKEVSSCTCITPVNIAIVKYWGKKDEELNTPINSSFSITLDTDKLFTETKVHFLRNGERNESVLVIDGVDVKLQNAPKVAKVLEKAKSLGLNCPVMVESKNSFPSCVGLASSSSAFSALALSLGRMLGLDDHTTYCLSRIGSGSSCRSLFGGFVEWSSGLRVDGSDSIPRQIFRPDRWPQLRIIILQVSDSPKSVPSGVAMQMSVQTSELLRLKTEAKLSEARIELLKKAIESQDFELFGEIIMKDSNTFHSICSDTYPPIEPPYLSPVSHNIIRFVHEINRANESLFCAYTFDAGPNAFIFTLEPNVKMVLECLFTSFPNHPSTKDPYIESVMKQFKVELPNKNLPNLNISVNPNDVIQYMYLSKVGNGPQIII